jgi:hypothetical protein
VATGVFILADVGAKAFWLLIVWLASAIAASEIAKRKGYTEKAGLGTGLLLSAIGVVVWLLIPAKADSWWKTRGKSK